jgi:hypothetical protein
MLELGRIAGDGGIEPAHDGLSTLHEIGRSVTVSYRDSPLFRYVYAPWEPPIEAPHPYVHPLRTLAGETISLYRPHDHVWHKGLTFAVANVDDDNFWGGPTFQPGVGYQMLDNHGTIEHLDWTAVDSMDERVVLAENLAWVDSHGSRLLAERRVLAVDTAAERQAWRLSFATALTNAVGRAIVFGSPTTRGRANAGYGGLAWRGPRSFTGGFLVSPDTVGGDELMGTRADWMAFVGLPDGRGTASSIVFADDPANPGHPTTWFARSERYALLGPAPFFDHEHRLAPGETLRLRYDVIIADGPVDVDRGHELVALFRGRATGAAGHEPSTSNERNEERTS